jgi:ubiquinone/menaquinone biosynthesis C-methylase UbiE
MKGISAYEARERIAAYDAEMEIMHPNRARMVAVALEILPFSRDDALTAVDLGVGTGYFTQRFLQAFPNASVHAIDGSDAAIAMAQERLSGFAHAIDYRTGDFRELARLLPDVSGADVVYSSYALHHLTRE